MKYLDNILSFFGLIRKKKTLDYLFIQYHKWAEKQFPKSTALSSIEGLKREVIELEDEINKMVPLPFWHERRHRVAYEYVDVMMYCLDSSRRYGIKPLELFDFFRKKLEINQKRKWAINPDKSYSHVELAENDLINRIPPEHGGC